MEQVLCLVDKGLVAYSLTIVVNENVAHNGIHPTFKISIRGIFILVIQSFQRCFL